MIKALSIESSEDLTSFSQYLWSRAVAHQVSDEEGHQVIWVTREMDVETVKNEYTVFKKSSGAGFGHQPQQQRAYDAVSWHEISKQLSSAPWVTSIIIISILITFVLNSPVGATVFAWLRMGSPAYVLESGEAWRLITPIFMHANTMHLAFNMLMLWVFGHQIERQEPKGLFLVLMLAFAVLPNVAQYYTTGSLFGGMSGVVYGVMGYCWLAGKWQHQKLYQFPNALMGFMMAWLLLGYSNILSFVGFGSMANSAHLGGLITGLAGAFCVTFFKRNHQRN